MAEVTLDQVPRKMREMFDKAASALERGNTDYAWDMLASILEQEPRLLQARRLLRASEIKRFREGGGGGAKQMMATLSGMGGLLSAQAALKSNPLKALSIAEKLLRNAPLNKHFYTLFAKAAVAADMPEAAVHTLEAARDTAPDDVDLLGWLADIYKLSGDTQKARAIYEHVAALRPNDPKAIKALKDAQAMDTMKSGRWTEAKSYRDVIKDQDEAKSLEKQAKAVKTASDIGMLIDEHRQKIEREPQNINYRRALADLYTRDGRYDDALAALEEASRISGGGDPQIDRAISALQVRKFDAKIAELRQAGNEAAAQAAEEEKDVFLLTDAEDRVKRYPNDLQFKYEFGTLLFDHDRHDEAIQQFQQSQRNPQRRIRSLYFLARCFEAKGLFDIAGEQLEKAASELTIMDETKKDILYELGVVAEKMDRRDQAAEYFKQIYAVDISYRDVAARIEKSYGKG